MSNHATLKQGDTGPTITATLYNPDGTVANLVGATVKLNARGRRSGTLLIDHATVTVLDAANGRVSYQPKQADTVSPGVFSIEFEVTYVDQTVVTYPNDRAAILEIVRQVD